MAKYINKDEAYKIVLHYGSYVASNKINDMPSIDLVRCRECKWFQEGYDINGKWFSLSRCNGSVRTYGQTTPDWYCADGERKEAEHEV